MTEKSPALKRAQKFAKIAFIVLAVIIVFIALLPDPPEVIAKKHYDDSVANEQKAISQTVSPPKEIPSAPTPEPRLIENLDAFQARFNLMMKQLHTDFYIRHIQLDPEGASSVVRVARYSLNDYIALTLTVNKSDLSVREVSAITIPDGSTMSTLNIMAVKMGIIYSVDPELEPSRRSDILSAIIPDERAEKVQTVQNNIRYWGIFHPSMGYFFGASPVE